MEVMSNKVKVGDPVVSGVGGVLALVAKFTNWFSFFFLLVCLFVFCFFRKPQFFQYSKLDAHSTMKCFWSTFWWSISSS